MLTYRFATFADLDILAELNRQLIQDEGHRNPMNLAQLRDRMQGWLETSYRAVLFERDGQVAAYALYRFDPDAVYLRHFFVVRERRRTGVGRAAIQLLLAEVFPTDATVRLDVLIGNERAQAFWQAIGFLPYAVTMERMPSPLLPLSQKPHT